MAAISVKIADIRNVVDMPDYPFLLKCAQKRSTLPKFECGVVDCPWYICSSQHKNCFWVLAQELVSDPISRTLGEIAEIEGITEEAVTKIFNQAMKKVTAEVHDSSDYFKQ